MNRQEIRDVLERLGDEAPDATPAEHAIVSVIALHAADEATKDPHGRVCPEGECWLYSERLAKLSGLTPDGVKKALRRLARRGLDVRVPFVPGASGQGAYSHTGSAPHYRVPKALLTDRRWDHRPTQGGTTGPPKVGPQAHPKDEEKFEDEVRTSSSSSLTAGAARPSEVHSLQDQRRAVELMITAYLARAFGCISEPAVVAYLQRTFRSHMHRDAAAFARYLLRLHQAAPEEMTEIALLKAEDHHGFLDEVSGPLGEARAAAKGHRLSRADLGRCDSLAAWAESAVSAGMTVEEAAEEWPGVSEQINEENR
jgi:hypothetical protein